MTEPSIHSFEVVAYNFAIDSDNKIHDDEVAATYGFKGGLVPGVGVLGYMSRAVSETWSSSWLANGGMSAKFLHPVYEGDLVRATARAADDSGGLQLELHDSEGRLCAVGEAFLTGEGSAPAAESFPFAVLPEMRLPPEAVKIPVGQAVGTLDVAPLARESHRVVADRYRDDLDLYAGEGAFLHPAFLPDQADTLLSSNVALGPWIHTQSQMRFFEALRPGPAMQLRGRFADAYEKRGHQMVELDLALVCDDRVAATIRHFAIVRPRAGAGT